MNTLTSVLLILFFTFASSIKLTGWHKQIFDIQLGFFTKYGLNRQAMWLVGAIELTGATLMLMNLFGAPHLLQSVGAGLLVATSLGAIGFHLKYDLWRDAVPALITLLLSAGLLAFA